MLRARTSALRALKSFKARQPSFVGVRSGLLKQTRSCVPIARGFATQTDGQVPQQENGQEKFEFQAETSKLLDIVTNAIYTDKEIFLRELVSNCADALEKFRHKQTTGEVVSEDDRELGINITIDEENGTLTIADTGIGMTKTEMMENLGTIARSGSKKFVEESDVNDDVAKNVIGQFGVGFYSAFMVGHKVEVFSRSALSGEPAHVWTSGGTDDFTITTAPGFDGHGTRIVIHLKEAEKAEYTKPATVKDIIKKYSNYVGFPVKVNGEQANEVSAIWTRDKSSVTDEEYTEFYRFCAHAFDEPLYKLHFKTDAPIDLKALLFVPSFQTEKAGMARMKPGVSLHSRKVLLEQNSDKLLPDWMRFVKGVVDSEDLPISLSRETMQDNRLLLTIKRALTRRVLKLLTDEAKKNPDEFNEKFALEFGSFLKEGVCQDYENQAEIAKLLRFSSSQSEDGKMTSLDEYISRCTPEQKEIYYLSAPSKKLAEASPYFEVFKKKGIEVLFLYNTIDDFVMSNLGEYQGRKFVAAESGKLELDGEDSKDTDDDASALSADESESLIDWMKQELDDVVTKITPTKRLEESPAIVVDHESAALRRMMKMLQQGAGTDGGNQMDSLPKQHMEINVKHPIVKELNQVRNTNPKLANAISRQLYDNALISAGLVDDPRIMLPRLNKLLETLLEERK